MKFFHLSDLHLGKRLHEASLIEDQKYILEQVLNYVRDEKPDGIIIAGDIYDKAIPSEEAVALFDEFVTELSLMKLPVFVVSGNHDSAIRMACCNKIINACGVHISSTYNGEEQKFTLMDEFGNVNVYLLPFVKPANVKHFLDEAEAAEIGSYHDAVAKAIASLDVNGDERNIIVAHQFVTGAERCESEDIPVGGIDNVAAEAFDAFDYVALGHIHGPQNVGGQERIRYCGTPLKYSFSEANHKKSITVVELGAKGDLQLNFLPFKPLRDLHVLRGTYDELTLLENREGMNVDDYVKIILTDENDVPNALSKLRVIYHNLLQLEYDNARTRNNSKLQLAEEVEKKSEVELFAEFYEKQNGTTLEAGQKEYLCELIEKLKEAEYK